MLNQTTYGLSRPSPAEAEGRTNQPALAIVDRYAQIEVADHPFFVELRARAVDLQAVWMLMVNLRAGISHDFIVWLATTIARVEDRRIGSLLAKQLDDELGHGQFEWIHSALLDRFIGGLARWRLNVKEEPLLSPGRRLAEQASKLFQAPEPYEGVGALIVGEIFAEKMDRCLGDEIRRQHALDDTTLIWLTLHEQLEHDHAGDSYALARLVPEQGPELSATWRGAVAQWNLLWEFLDGVHALATIRGCEVSIQS